MKSKNPMNRPTNLEVPAEIINFVLDSADEVEAMSDEEINADLTERGIDLEDRKSELLAKVAAACKRAQLNTAQQERTGAVYREQYSSNKPTRVDSIKRGFPTIDALKAEAGRRLGLQQGSAAYFRRLENATQEDLIEMLHDWEELQEPSGDS